jgi:hypothetical protein
MARSKAESRPTPPNDAMVHQSHVYMLAEDATKQQRGLSLNKSAIQARRGHNDLHCHRRHTWFRCMLQKQSSAIGWFTSAGVKCTVSTSAEANEGFRTAKRSCPWQRAQRRKTIE